MIPRIVRQTHRPYRFKSCAPMIMRRGAVSSTCTSAAIAPARARCIGKPVSVRIPSLRRFGVAVQTRMEQSFFTRNVGYVLLRVRCCLSYRDWNAHTGLRDIEWVEHDFPVLRLAELQELLIDRQIGYHLASQLRQDPRCSVEKLCYTDFPR